MRFGRRGVVCGGLLAVFAFAAIAMAASHPSNGGFEKGNLKGWKAYAPDESNGVWKAYKQGQDLNQDSMGTRGSRRGGPAPTTLYKPPQGKYAAYAFGGGGVRFMSRKLKLHANRKITLQMEVFYKNFADKFATPRTLDPNAMPVKRGGSAPNQQYRIDVIKSGADIDSLAKDDILKNVFRTKVGDKLKRKPFKVSVNLSDLAGQTVRLRFAEVDNQYYFLPGVDAVSLKQTKK